MDGKELSMKVFWILFNLIWGPKDKLDPTFVKGVLYETLGCVRSSPPLLPHYPPP